MKRLMLVFVVLMFILIGCGGGEMETAVAPEPTPLPPTAEPQPTAVPPTAEPEPTSIPPTATPLPPTEEPQAADLTALEEALQGLVDAQVTAGVPGAILMVDAPGIGFNWQGAAGMADLESEIPMEPDTPFRVSGITNMMTASVLLRLAEDGMIGLDDPISQYLDVGITNLLNGPDGEPYGETITIRQLLNGTSGVAGYFFSGEEDIDGSFSPDFVDIIMNDPDKVWQPQEVVSVSTSNMSPFFAPGEAFGGSRDMEQMLLGLIIEAATGTNLAEAYQTWLFEPLGMTHTFLAQTDDPRLEEVAHVYYSSTLDVSNYASLSWLSDDVVSTMDDLNRFMWAWVDDDIFSTSESKEMMTQWISMADAGYDGLYHGMGILYADFEEWGMPEIGDLMGYPSLWNGFVFYWPQYHVVFAGTLNQVFPLSSYSELQFSTLQTVLPYVTEE